MDKIKCLKIGTYNLRNITDHYHLRLPLLKNTINEMNCDIIGLQEVSFISYNQLDDIFQEDKYTQYNSATQLNYGIINNIIDKEFNIDGNSLVTSKETEFEDPVKFNNLHLSPVRNCCMLSLVYNGIKISVVNTHLHHVPSQELIRLDQAKNMLRWIDLNTREEDIIIVLGDFNTLPFSDTYNNFLDNGYFSSYYSYHSCEPLKTFHNKMDAPHKDTDDEGTFDYIFVKQQKHAESFFSYRVEIKNIKLFGEEECKLNKGIYASDHYGMVVELTFEQI